MRYAGLYPTTDHLMLSLLSGHRDKWVNGIIVDGDELRPEGHAPRFPDDVDALTPGGWKHAVNARRVPTHWPKPTPCNPIFNIPDDADESWLQEIDMFVYRMSHLNPKSVHAWIKLAQEFTGSGRDYQEARNAENIAGYDAIQEGIRKHRIKERIGAIRNMRLPVYVRPPAVTVGGYARFHTGVAVAYVVAIENIPMRHGGTQTIVKLDSPLEGTSRHFYDCLVPVESPTTDLHAPAPEKIPTLPPLRERVHDVWGEAEDFPKEDWQDEVKNGDTHQGYWEWVEHQRNKETD